MTEHLAPATGLSDGFNALKDAATIEFRSPSLQHATLAMIGCGWDPKPDGSYKPFCVTISNFIENRLPRVPDGRSRNGVAVGIAQGGARRGTFDWYAVALPSALSASLHVAGQPLPNRRIPVVIRAVKRAIRAQAQPLAFIRILAEEIWHVAQSNPRVGSSLMAVSLPQSAASRSGPVELVGGPPQPNHLTAMYLPGPNAGPVHYMANLAGAGACFTDASVEPL